MKILLVNSPSAEQELVGNSGNSGVRNLGYFDKMKDIETDEVIKNAAVQLNVSVVKRNEIQINNEWRRAVSLFKLCNNWDHAADILVIQTAQCYYEHNSTWRDVLSDIESFINEIHLGGDKNISLINQQNLIIIQQMMTILDLANNSSYFMYSIIHRSF